MFKKALLLPLVCSAKTPKPKSDNRVGKKLIITPMQVFNENNYNAYPVTAIGLCAISYLNNGGSVSGPAIANAVTNAYNTPYNPNNYDPNNPPIQPNTPLETSIVWGPAFSPVNGFATNSLMFIAQVKSSSEYFVVIRGTDPISLSSWINEDLEVDTIVPLNTLPNVPSSIIYDDITISLAAFNGMSDLLGLTDPNTNQSALTFLQNTIANNSDAYIYVTGHSLGGTLTPVMFSYLNAILFNGNTYCNMAMWSFAGLTAGGTNFNDYVDHLNPNAAFNWRIPNTLDIAPFLVGPANINQAPVPSDITNIYSELSIDPGSYALLMDLFSKANATTGTNPPGLNFYLQPSFGINPINGTYQPALTHIPLVAPWATQALYQHHASTYYQMVYQSFMPA